MGILGGIRDTFTRDYFTPGGTDAELRRLQADGELLPARVHAIHVVGAADRGPTWSYGLDVATPEGPVRTTVSQHVLHHAELLTLGSTVQVRHLDGLTAIDWSRTLAAHGIEHTEPMLPTRLRGVPLEGGIRDSNVDRAELERGQRLTAVVVREDALLVLGRPTCNVDLHLDLPDGDDDEVTRRLLVRRVLVPDYARARLTTGAQLPVTVDRRRPDRVAIDWETFASGGVSDA